MQKQGKISYLIFLILSILLSSCHENSQAEKLIQARNIINDKPEDALILLESMPHPETMSEENYMLYILTKTDAKIKIKQDVSNDTLIYKAQSYFDTKNNEQIGALVNWLAGKAAYDRDNYDKSLDSYLLAEHYARRAKNDLIIAKSLYGIGNLYFIQENMDTAIVRYKEGYKYYSKTVNTERDRLFAYQQIGRTYEDMTNLDSALVYFEKGSLLASQLKNSEYETRFTFLKGVVLWEKGDYKQSEECLYKALEETKNDEEALKIRLNLARLYIKIGKLDAAQSHLDEIKSNLSKISDNFGLRSVYTSLIDFYKLNGEYEEAFYYSNLKEKVVEKISDESWLDKLLIVEKKHQQYIKDKESAEAHQKLITLSGIIFGVAFFLCFIAAMYLRNKRLKFEKELKQSQLLDSQDKFMKHRTQSLSFLQSIHHNIIYDWAKVDEEIQELAEEFGAEERPVLINKIQRIIDELRNKSNQQLIENARIHLRESGVKELTIKKINDKQLLIFILIRCGYSRKDMSVIMGSGIAIDDDDFDFHITALKSKLKRFRVAIEEVKQEPHLKEMNS